MKKEGTVAKWDDARGFGFIRSPASAADVFFHVRDFHGGSAGSPRQGLAVTFEEINVGGKGPRGMAVRPAGGAANHPVRRRHRHARVEAAPSGSGALGALPLMLIYAVVILWAVWTRTLPWWVLVALPALNMMTFYAYWQDKYAAETGRWRIKEDTLHLFSLAGGWPGAWFAQQILRHKSRKAEFRAAYWATVTLNFGAIGGWLWWATRVS
ncbi:DUF1294 domain-containing protein [Caenimonas soli]|uniref:DUF1294 domain-containing protein n=1 Tax=Caenimonas soli TaxID=2735555 RepID=UPI0015561763|nr:cold shock and DUF1294 domain-containing protein [Caenimonas soli]NPC59095.1 DUF1294 domain-containing protein [Caenimonas soli]